jgi:DNA-binding transcriptional regulator YdaS (Cro superfamily)
MKKMTPQQILERIIEDAGGITKFSASIGVSRQAVDQWQMIPIKRLAAVEKVTGISRTVLRPDLFEGEPVMRAVEYTKREIDRSTASAP